MYKRQIYGYIVLLPILLNFIFNIVTFVEDLKNDKAKLFEVVFLFIYAQYRCMKFLAKYIFVHRDEQTLNADTEEHNRDVAHMEAYMESGFQVFKVFLKYSKISKNNASSMYIISNCALHS